MSEEPTDGAGWRLEIRHLRGLQEIDWSPEGVCALVGPNGSGKTTLLKALAFMRDLYTDGPERALVGFGGVYGQRNLSAPADKLVSLGLQVGEVRWVVAFNVVADRLDLDAGEAIYIGDEPALRRPPYTMDYTFRKTEYVYAGRDRTCLRSVMDNERPKELKPLTDLLQGIRVFGPYDLAATNFARPEDWSTQELRSDGRNVLNVLSNWRSAPRQHNGRFDWIVKHLRAAFPEVFLDLDLTPLPPSSIQALFYPANAGPHDRLPLSFAADGLKIGLMHLTAVASAQPGAVVAIDEFENHLHPFAINTLLGAIEELADERDLKVILTTHSPVVLNAFKARPERVFVFEELGRGPRSLDGLFKPSWLARFSLGHLYERLQFGGPAQGGPDEAG